MSLAGCDEQASGLLEVEEALEQINQAVDPVIGYERIALPMALNRVLAEEIVAPFDVPPHRNSAMDGFAVRAADLSKDQETPLTLVGKSFAGLPFTGTLGAGECIRIMTGAVVPEGADTVIMQEHVSLEGSTATMPAAARPGDHIRHPGEDMKSGESVLSKGKLLTSADIGLIASLGIGEVSVTRKPRVVIFSTGDELKGIGQALGKGDIYDSNRYTLNALLSHFSVETIDFGVIKDDQEAVRQAFTNAAALADLVITSGGASVGEADYVKQTLDELGEVGFWKIAMKPGKPLAFGKVGNAMFLGLPGNPVSVMATFVLFVRPALMKLQGQAIMPPLSVKVRLGCDIRKKPGRREYQRGILAPDEAGELVASTTGMQGSHMLSSMSRANCFIVLPRYSEGLSKGDPVEVIPLSGLV